MSEKLPIGGKAPDFELLDQSGNTFRLASALEKGPVVVYFYPKDFTGGCTAEACSFRDLNPEFAAAGAQVVGISRDPVESHRRFADAHRLPFTLLSDAQGAVSTAFGVEKVMFGLIDGRVTFVLDRAGVVRHRFEGLLRATKHVDEALRLVRQLAA
jgi:peroxiredoxin Q/BCP